MNEKEREQNEKEIYNKIKNIDCDKCEYAYTIACDFCIYLMKKYDKNYKNKEE